jgi:formylglycine-generating enzyme required for sulfatase activity
MKPINDMTSREAMDIKNIYHSKVLANANSFFSQFKNLSIDALLDILNNPEFTISQHWVAANLLGMQGDPRIDIFNPTMIIVPAAKVPIGSTLTEIESAFEKYHSIGVKKEWLLKEYPQHEIVIPSFKIAKYLVTNYEYFLFLNEVQTADIPNSWNFGIYDPTKANYPVYGITPEGADNYAKWLSTKTNRHYRLPTEYEWEYAAAGPNGNEYPWGNVFSTHNANTLESGLYCATPVGIFPSGASPFGCLDMAGNVEEYVATDYFAYPNGTTIKDDLGIHYRMARGGSFTRYSDLARCKRRHGFFDKDIYVMGFRIVEEIARS